MFRKLSLVLAIAAVLSPSRALAVGLGDINAKSHLNQRFNAEIDLLSVDKGELDDVKVELASPEAFQRAGVDRPFLLSRLRFEPARQPDGSAVIRVTSRDPIREPFLNFLIEVNWPKGRLIREYTVLLDPPVMVQRRPPQVQAPKAAPQRAMPATQAMDTPREAMATSHMPAYSAPMAQGDLEYGPTEKNDTLWRIAKGMQRPGTTVEQVMMALLNENPDAFVDNNVNNLKVGKILRISDPENITAMSPRQARSEFMAQMRQWEEARGAPGETTDSVPTEDLAGQTKPDQLKIASADPEGEDPGTAREGLAEAEQELTDLRSEMMILRETSESTRQENAEMRSRVQELEDQLRDIQRLLTLKSDELARVQAMDQETAPAPEEEAAPEEAEPAAMVPEAEQEIAITEEAVKPLEEDELKVPEEETVVAVTEPEPEAEPVVEPEPETAAPVAEAEPAETIAEPTPAPVAKSPLQEAMDKLGGSTTVFGIAGAVLVVLLALFWMVVRRRKAAEEEFQESILVTPKGEAVAAAAGDAAPPPSQHSDETSFLSDFSPSDIDALQDDTGEVDPISEADVYIAYGRYQQAEELISQAIQRDPERVELKRKLLEIHFANKNAVAYTALAAELKDAGVDESDPETWTRIVAMGSEIAPDQQLFASQQPEPDDDAGIGTPVSDELADLDLTEPSVEAEAKPMDESLDFDLGELDKEIKIDMEASVDQVEEEAAEVADENTLPDLEFDLSELGDMEAKAEGEEETGADIGLERTEPVEDVTVRDIDQAVSGQAVEQQAGDDEELDLDGLDFEGLGEIAGQEENREEPPSISLEELEAAASDDAGELILDGVDTGDEMDEVNTKLDLARAYVDMGDAEGAKSILEEVLTEGNDVQKQEAEELMQQVS